MDRPAVQEARPERDLRGAAPAARGLPHLHIGWRAHPDYRGEQSLNVLAHAALGGIDHQGRIFLALSTYFRHTGPDDGEGDELSERLKAVVSKRTQKRARIIGVSDPDRAHDLDRDAGVILDTPLSYDGDRLVLTLPKARAALDGERLRRRLESLAQLLGRQAEI